MLRATADIIDVECYSQVTVVDILFHLCCLFYWMHEFREATKCELIGIEDVWQFAIEKALVALSQVYYCMSIDRRPSRLDATC